MQLSYIEELQAKDRSKCTREQILKEFRIFLNLAKEVIIERNELSLHWEEEYDRANNAEINLRNYEAEDEEIIKRINDDFINCPSSPTTSVESFSSMTCEPPCREVRIVEPISPPILANTWIPTSTKGQEGEYIVYSLLMKYCPVDCQVIVTRQIPHHADFMLIYSRNAKLIGYSLVDAKNYQGSVPFNQVEKFGQDIKFCTATFGIPPIWGAVISISSKISCPDECGSCNFFNGEEKIHLIHGLHNSEDQIKKLFYEAQPSVTKTIEKFFDETHSSRLTEKNQKELHKIIEKCSKIKCFAPPRSCLKK